VWIRREARHDRTFAINFILTFPSYADGLATGQEKRNSGLAAVICIITAIGVLGKTCLEHARAPRPSQLADAGFDLKAFVADKSVA